MLFNTHSRVKTARLLILALCLSLSAQLSFAHPQLPGARLQGEATLHYFGFRVYHARLWTLPNFQSDELNKQTLVLELEYLREFKGSAIAQRSLKEMQRAASISETQGQSWLSEMQRIFPDVKAGDRISGQLIPGQGVKFWHNGHPIGQIDNAAFADLFFSIWLAPTTSEPDMRLALLGQTNSSSR